MGNDQIIKTLVIVMVAFLIPFKSGIGFAQRMQSGHSNVLRSAPIMKHVSLQKDDLFQLIPKYVDLAVGDTVAVTRADASEVEIRIAHVEIESALQSCPRTRVGLESGGAVYSAYCGMKARKRGGIGPTEINGVKVGVEITRLLFSRMKGGTSPFNTYASFRLQKDVRLAIWDGSMGIMPGIDGVFVLNQKDWANERYGNWLHNTGYGIHSAIDIFTPAAGAPLEVRSPVKGTVYRIYNQDSGANDRSKSKAVNIYGDDVVGPGNDRILYRFFHLSEIIVDAGEPVQTGQVIGLAGHTGISRGTPDHLHFEMRLNPSHFGLPENGDIFASIPVNPYFYLLEWWGNGQMDKK